VPRYDTAAIYWDTEKDQAFHDFAFKAHSEGSIPIFWACSETMDLLVDYECSTRRLGGFLVVVTKICAAFTTATWATTPSTRWS